MKGFIRTNLIAAFMLFFAAASAYAAPNILSATINYATNQITVNGTYIVKGTSVTKVVFEGTNNLAVIGTPTATTITAQLPSGLVPGTYEIKIVNGYGTSANFKVTYGAAGPKGDTGAPGAVLPIGNTFGTIAAGDDPRFWDARVPLAGSANYIQNNQSGPQIANLNIAGNGTFGGNVNAGGILTGSVTASGAITGSSVTVSGAITGNGSGLTNLTASGIPLASSDPAPANAGNTGNLYFNTGSGTAKMSDGNAWRDVRTGRQIGRLNMGYAQFSFNSVETTIPFDSVDIIYSDVPGDFGPYNHGFILLNGRPSYYKIYASFGLIGYTAGADFLVSLYLDGNVIRTYTSVFPSSNFTTFNIDDIISVTGAGIGGYHTLYMTIKTNINSAYLQSSGGLQTYWTINLL